MRHALRRLFGSPESGLVMVLVIVTVMLTALAGSHLDRADGAARQQFWNSYTLIQTATDASFFAIMAVGATLVIISGGIDLSVGSIYALSGVTHGDRAARRWSDGARRRRSSSASCVCVGVGSLCGVAQRLARRRTSRTSVHHHARHDVDAARDRVRGDEGREHPVPTPLTACGEGVARTRRRALSRADARR